MRTTLVVLAALAALPLVALAQKPVTETDAVEISAKIEAIDRTARLVTLTDKAGDTETIYCGPEVKRFDELKVGDTVTFRYYESVVYAIRQPGQPAPTTGEKPEVVRGTGPKPAGTVSQQITASVVITAIDPAVPSVTVRTDDGVTMSFKVEDKKNIEGVKVDDRVDITYTMALAVSVEAPKPKR